MMTTTLADLDMHLLVFPDALPPHGIHAARKALARLSQAAGRPATAILLEGALSDHAALKADSGKGWYDEHAALEHLLNLPRLPADLIARIRTGTATMVDAKELVAMQDWGDERVRIRAAIDRLDAKLFERQAVRLGGLLATEAVIEPILAGFSHLDFVLQPAAWATMKSRVRRAVRLVDVHARTRLSASLLSGGWAALVAAAKANPKQAGRLAKLWPLLTHCTRLGIEPTAVCDSTVSGLLSDLDGRRKDAFAVARDTVYAWEGLQEAIPEWPAIKLTRLQRNGRIQRGGTLSYDTLPASLREEWEAFCGKHGRDDRHGIAVDASLAEFVPEEFEAMLAEDTAITGTYAPTTLRNMRSMVVALAEAAVSIGAEPASLEAIVAVPVVRAAMTGLARRLAEDAKAKGQPYSGKSGTLTLLATTAIAVARRVGQDDRSVAQLVDLRDKVDPRLIRINSSGRRFYHDKQMGKRHADRLRTFNDPVRMNAWFELPYRLIGDMQRIARAGGPTTLEQIGDAVVAALYAITLCCPARRGNLARLTIAGPHPNIWLPPNGKGLGRLHIDWVEVKNRVDLNAELDPLAVRALTLWLRVFRPVHARMVGATDDNPYLFPAYGKNHRAAELLNKGFVERNRRAGIDLNLQCQRHLCAKVVLDQDPTRMQLVSDLLGHRHVRTTKRYYADVSDILVQREFHDLLEKRRKAIFGELPRGLF